MQLRVSDNGSKALEITDELIARQSPEARAIIRALLVRLAELEARLNQTSRDSSVPPGNGRILTWASTGNFLQAEGFFFKNAVYLLDDFKPEVIDSPGAAVRLIQNYADGTARGRLKGGGGEDEARPIRGQLVSTGESVLDHSPSAVSRLGVVRVPEGAMDTARGARCLEHCHGYRGLMAAFIHHLLASGRLEQFARRQAEAQAFFLEGVAELPNALRVAANLGTLAAALEEFAVFLHDAVPTAVEEVQTFIETELMALRNEMLHASRDQHQEDTFLSVLGDLVRSDRVRIVGFIGEGGRVIDRRLNDKVVVVSLPRAPEAVNAALRSRWRPGLTATQRQILDSLRDDGVLVYESGSPVLPTDKAEAKVVRVGDKPTRCLLILP